MNNIERALMVAEKAHVNQTYDIYPYMYHIRMTWNIIKSLGFGETMQIASILHDAIEDTVLTYNDIRTAFGKEVAEIVFAVTDGLGRNRKERKLLTYKKVQACWKATVVKICDRVANMQHSKQYTPDKFKMYINELSEFESLIRNDKHPSHVEIAWTLLKQFDN